MNTVPAILRLIDFSAEAKGTSLNSESASPPTAQVELLPTPSPSVTRENLEEAVSHAVAEAEARAAVQMQQVREECERHLERERLQLADQNAEVLAEKVAEQFSAAREKLAEQLLDNCRPVLGQLARDKAVEELLSCVGKILQTNCKLTVKGPRELLQVLRDRLAHLEMEMDWQETNDIDISVGAGDTIIETQLSEWLHSLDEKVEDGN